MRIMSILVRDGLRRFLSVLAYKLKREREATIVDLDDLEEFRVEGPIHHLLSVNVALRLASGEVACPFVLTPATTPPLIAELTRGKQEGVTFARIYDELRQQQDLGKGDRFFTYAHYTSAEHVKVLLVEGSTKRISIRLASPLRWRLAMLGRWLAGWRRKPSEQCA